MKSSDWILLLQISIFICFMVGKLVYSKVHPDASIIMVMCALGYSICRAIEDK